MVAGEASGDVLASLLMRGMRQRWPQFRAHGIGGPRMAEQGFDAWWPHSKLSVHGFSWELLRRYREIVGIRKQLRERLLASAPTAFIGVDAPDFNLDLEASLRAAGVPTIHFVSPSIWAWRAERVEKIRRSADHVLCIFPFEPELLARHGISASYVGHPLASVIPMEPDQGAARQALGFGPDDPVVALLPGSRPAEIRHLALRFLQAAALMLRQRPDLRFVLPAAPGLRPVLDALAAQAGLGHRLTLLDGQSHLALAACDVTLIASGTATLEAALFKCPMVIAYHMGRLSWELMRRKRLQPWVGLPNILCGDMLVPELLQDQASPVALAQCTLQWLEDCLRGSNNVRALRQRFIQLHEELRRDTATIATHAIEEVIRR